MKVKCSEKGFIVEPNQPELNAVLTAIGVLGDPDKLVTYALRRHGYGNDFYSLTYHDDLDDHERADYDIPEGHVEVCRHYDDTTHVIKEEIYLNLLAQVCELKDMVDRAQLLRSVMESPDSLKSLLEANASRCNQRWQLFAPFLENNGWRLNGDQINHKQTNGMFNLKHITEDLDVLLRTTQRSLERYQGADLKWQQFQQSIIKALNEFFSAESKSN